MRSVGEDVSICEEKCGSVEKCCVGGVEKRGKTQKGLHDRRHSFFRTKSKKTKKWSYMFHELLNLLLLSPLFRFSPPGVSLSPSSRRYHPL